MKKTILVLSLLSLVVPTNSAEIHAWVDSAAVEGYYWTIDTLYDSIQWTISEVNAQGRSSFPDGDTFVCWGKLKNPMPMPGTNQYYSISRITPHFIDTVFLAMGYKQVDEWFVATEPSGGYFEDLTDTAIWFDIFTNKGLKDSIVLFGIQGSKLVGKFTSVTDKTIQRPTINVSRSCRYFFANGRVAPAAATRRFSFTPNWIIAR